jgi:hypothetical protein
MKKAKHLMAFDQENSNGHKPVHFGNRSLLFWCLPFSTMLTPSREKAFYD